MLSLLRGLRQCEQFLDAAVSDVNELYPQGYRTFVDLEKIEQNAREGRARPGHFRGVATGRF